MKLATKGYVILGGGACLWILAAVMCAKFVSTQRYDFKASWEPMRDLHDLPARDASSVAVSTEK